MVRQSRSQSNNSGWRPPAESATPHVDPAEEAWARKVAEQNRAEAERVARQQQQFREFQNLGNSAFRQRNYREALHHYRQLANAHRDAGIFSPQLQNDIERAEAYLAWNEAKTAAQLREATRRRPDFFSAENFRHIEETEEWERIRREQPLREAANRAALEKVGGIIENLAVAMDSGPVTGTVLGGDARSGRRTGDLFGGVKSDPQFLQNDGASDEHAAVEHGLGFDNFGRLKGEMAPPPPPPPAVAVGIPERVRLNPEFQRLPEVVRLREYEAKAEEETRAAAIARAHYEEKKAENPTASELILLNFRAKDAEDRARAAKNMATVQLAEIQRTVSFAPFDVGPPTQGDKAAKP